MGKHGKLEKRLLLMRPIKNGVGEFIPYCNYEPHKGVIKHNNYTLCEKRKCTHYLRLYLTYRNI